MSLRVKIRLIAVVLVFAVMGVAAWFAKRGDLSGIVALGQDNALIVWLEDDEAGEATVEMVDLLEGRQWRARLPHLAHENGGLDVAVDRDVILVRARDRGRVTSIALSRQDGRVLWAEPTDRRGEWSRLVASQGESFELENQTLLARDVRTGREIWRTPLPSSDSEGVEAWARPSHLVVHHGSSLTLIDRRRGGIDRTVAIDGTPCVTARAAYRTESSRLLQMQLASQDEAVLSLPLQPGEWELSDYCGWRSSFAVLNLREASGDQLVVAIDEAATQVRWLKHVSAAAAWNPAHRSDEATLPLRIPVAQHDGSISMWDLEDGEKLWGSAPQSSPGRVFLHGSSSYLRFVGLNGERLLAAFEGETGALVAAIDLGAYRLDGLDQFAGAHVWLFDEHGWQVIDANNLQPVAGRTSLEFDDERATVERLLGL